MRWGSSSVAGLLCLVVACGGIAIVDGEGGSGTGGATAQGAGAAGSTGTPVGTSSGTPAGSSAGAASGADTTESYVPEIVNAVFWAGAISMYGCPTNVPLDSLDGEVTIQWQKGEGGPATSTIVSTTLVGPEQASLETAFELTPTTVSGDEPTLVQVHEKVFQSANGTHACDFCGLGEITLLIEVLLGSGELVVVQAPASYTCP